MVYKLSKNRLITLHKNGIFVCCRCNKKLKVGDEILLKGHAPLKKNFINFRTRSYRIQYVKRAYHKECFEGLYFEAPKVNKNGEVVVAKK